MCGIVGFFAYAPDAKLPGEAEAIRVRDVMTPRGPDDAGLWRSEDGRVALGSRRLAIIDLSPAGHQPMGLPDGSAWIAFNGEIYNYRKLRHELEQQGRVFRSASDTEVLLHAYAVHGPAMVERLRGMFAFALWDPKRGGMLLARDPLGIKPLYYADDGDRIVAASQVKAVLLAEGVGRAPSSAGQVSFLLWGSVSDPFTIFRDIHALPSGTTLWIDRRGAQTPRRYWRLGEVLREAEARRAMMPPQAFTPTAKRETLREALNDSIRHHVIADVPVAAFLSGGLDSAALVGLARDGNMGDLRTLTLGFDEMRGTKADETPYAGQTATAFGTRHSTQWIGAEQFAEARGPLLDAMDQPTVDGVNTYFVSRMAAAMGLKVALSGLGGDELFGGYPSFRQVPGVSRALAPFAWTPALGPLFRRISAPLLRHLTSPKYAGIIEYGTNVSDAYLLRRGLFMPWELPDLLGAEAARDGWDELAPRVRLVGAAAGIRERRSQVMALEMSFYMRHQLLRDSDWAGMAHSLEIRVPFVDAELLRQLAPLLIGPRPLSKRDMIATLCPTLPDSVLRRPKTGFTVPMRDWLARSDPSAAKIVNRGLRGWARYVLAQQLRAYAPSPALRRSPTISTVAAAP
jgi:asparagine synthase (glutamine-hydrolysing)